jgi:hypothetical protein
LDWTATAAAFSLLLCFALGFGVGRRKGIESSSNSTGTE